MRLFYADENKDQTGVVSDAQVDMMPENPIDEIELGFFGNIWVRKHVIKEAGGIVHGHKHHFDHVTLLAQGKIQIKVDEMVKEFTAPTFVVVRKEHNHEITALADNTVYYCVFALRDLDGEPIDEFYHVKHDPTGDPSHLPDYVDKNSGLPFMPEDDYQRLLERLKAEVH